MEIIDVNKDNFDSLIKKGEVLLDFYADWCAPCKLMEPELEKIKDKIQLVKVNTDQNMDLCKKYGVLSIPSLVYINKDGVVKKNNGFISSDDIIKFISE